VFQNKGHDEVNDDRASERKKRKVNKIHPDCGGADAKLLSPPCAHAECFVFEPAYNTPDHELKIQNFRVLHLGSTRFRAGCRSDHLCANSALEAPFQAAVVIEQID
jgi:hypothetical protein